MGVLVIKKYFSDPSLSTALSLNNNLTNFNVTLPTSTTAGTANVQWTQEILNNNPGATSLVLKSVMTQFTGNKHGYYDASLVMDLMSENFSLSTQSYENTVSHTLCTVDMGWDPTSDCSNQVRPLHLRIGDCPSLVRNVRFSINSRFTAYNGPILNQSVALLNSGNIVTNPFYNPTPATPAPQSNPIFPLYVELIFEYDSSNRH